MGIISCMGEDYTAPEIDIQSDSSATNLIDDEIPTGQTIKSYLNSNLGVMKGYAIATGANTKTVRVTCSQYQVHFIFGVDGSAPYSLVVFTAQSNISFVKLGGVSNVTCTFVDSTHYDIKLVSVYSRVKLITDAKNVVLTVI